MATDTAIVRENEPATADLSILVRIVELGTLSAVARERDVPVSHISRSVTRLEQAYQVRLLNRSTHGLTVTAEGDVVVAHARKVLESLDDLDAELDVRSGSPVGLVRLSVSQVMADVQVARLLPGLLEKHPALRIDVLASDRMVDLATEGIDIAVRTNIFDNENLVAKKVGEYGRALYATVDYLKRYGEPDTPESLGQHRCVTHAGSHTLNRWSFKSGRKMMSRTVTGHYRASNSGSILAMVRQSAGIGRLNTSIAGPLVDSGELVQILKNYRDTSCYPIYLVTLPGRHRLPKIRACVDHLARFYKALPAY